jgi:hypothetical protein
VAPPVVTPPISLIPIVRHYALSRSTFRAFRGRGVSIARAKRGTRVSYTLNEAGMATFTVHRIRPGRKVKNRKTGKRRCVKPTSKNRAHRTCKRYRRVGSFKRASVAGPNSFKFTGRVKGRRLAPGRYRMRLVVRDADGDKSKRLARRFRIVR